MNGDESEPGTFKDRELLLRTPHLVVEGVILAGLITGRRKDSFTFAMNIRNKSRPAAQRLRARSNSEFADRTLCCSADRFQFQCSLVRAAIFVASKARSSKRCPIVAANRVTCRRSWRPMVWTIFRRWLAMWRHLPGFRTSVSKRRRQLRGAGCKRWKGRRLFSVSGDVKRPGVYEVPMGLTLRDSFTASNFARASPAIRS